MNSERLYFIDIVRAFAILMMLQGHFIDTLLSIEYRDISSTAFKIWSYFRGITAPTFFTISGLIFTYLLLKAKEKGNEKLRIKKGIISHMKIDVPTFKKNNLPDYLKSKPITVPGSRFIK